MVDLGRPREAPGLLLYGGPELPFHPEELTKVSVRTNFSVVVPIKPSVVGIVGLVVDGQTRLHVFVTLRKRAEVEMGGPVAVMGLQRQLGIIAFGSPLKERSCALSARRSKAPPSPVDREVRRFLRDLPAQFVRRGVELPGLA